MRRTDLLFSALVLFQAAMVAWNVVLYVRHGEAISMLAIGFCSVCVIPNVVNWRRCRAMDRETDRILGAWR